MQTLARHCECSACHLRRPAYCRSGRCVFRVSIIRMRLTHWYDIMCGTAIRSNRSASGPCPPHMTSITLSIRYRRSILCNLLFDILIKIPACRQNVSLCPHILSALTFFPSLSTRLVKSNSLSFDLFPVLNCI